MTFVVNERIFLRALAQAAVVAVNPEKWALSDLHLNINYLTKNFEEYFSLDTPNYLKTFIETSREPNKRETKRMFQELVEAVQGIKFSRTSRAAYVVLDDSPLQVYFSGSKLEAIGSIGLPESLGKSASESMLPSLFNDRPLSLQSFGSLNVTEKPKRTIFDDESPLSSASLLVESVEPEQPEKPAEPEEPAQPEEPIAEEPPAEPVKMPLTIKVRNRWLIPIDEPIKKPIKYATFSAFLK
jgi:hypothetical protein